MKVRNSYILKILKHEFHLFENIYINLKTEQNDLFEYFLSLSFNRIKTL